MLEKSSRPVRVGGQRQSACPRGLGRVQARVPWPSEIEARRPLQANGAHEVQSMSDRRSRTPRTFITPAQLVLIFFFKTAAPPDLSVCWHAACCQLHVPPRNRPGI